MKNLVIVLVALAIGLGAGGFAMRTSSAARFDAMNAELDSIRNLLKSAQDDAAEMAERARFLERENDSLQLAVSGLEEMSRRTTPAADSDQMASYLEEAMAPNMPEFPMGMESPDAAREGERRGRFRDLSPEQREEWARRTEEFAGQMMNRVNDFYADAYARAGDRDSQERIALMQQYSNDMMEYGRMMWEAQTDEERRALQQNMGETMRAWGQLREDQQDATIRNMAASFGINDAKTQEAFVQAVRGLEEDPIFRPERMFMGGPGMGGPGMGGGGMGMMPGGGGAFGGRGRGRDRGGQ